MNKTELPMDETFHHAYQCGATIDGSTSASLQHYYYPGASTQGGRDGLLVEVSPEQGTPWLGTFAFGRDIANGATGIFATPNPRCICVVSKGAGYLVDVAYPGSWEIVHATPIIDIRTLPIQEMIVFADHTTLVAYGSSGIKWRTKRLTWDDLKIVEVTDTFIKGEYWDIRTEEKSSFIVDLATGTHQGGIVEL